MYKKRITEEEKNTTVITDAAEQKNKQEQTRTIWGKSDFIQTAQRRSKILFKASQQISTLTWIFPEKDVTDALMKCQKYSENYL